MLKHIENRYKSSSLYGDVPLSTESYADISAGSVKRTGGRRRVVPRRSWGPGKEHHHCSYPLRPSRHRQRGGRGARHSDRHVYQRPRQTEQNTAAYASPSGTENCRAYRRLHQTERNTAEYAARSRTEDRLCIPRAMPGRTEHRHVYRAGWNRRLLCTDAAPGGMEDCCAPMPHRAERRDNDTTLGVRKDMLRSCLTSPCCSTGNVGCRGGLLCWWYPPSLWWYPTSP